MNKHNKSRSSFSGKIGYVLAAAGASVGLGNIWRFPYLAAKYGGGIFLLIYILLALTFGYSMIVAESAIGRMTRKSPVGAFQSFGKSKWLSAGGWINAIIPILIVPYYSVIGGWVIKYLIEHGADINMQDNAGCTALMRASYSGYVDLVLYLLDQGADKSIKDFQGNLAIHYVREHCFAELKEHLK